MRPLLTSLLFAGALTTSGCARGDSRAASDTVAQSPVAANKLSSVLGDTDVVRRAGVATDADDTLPTRYNKHETSRRLAGPGCRPQGIALCLTDTATRVFSTTCCIADQRETDWLVFAAANDSLQLFVEATRAALLTMSPPNAAGASAETALSVDASWLRARFPTAGAYVFTADIESDSAAPYELRIAPVIVTGASEPIGAAAQLTLRGARKAAIAVAPHSMMPATDTAALRRFAVKPGRYRVLLVRDTLYNACVLPCAHRTTFTLKPGQAVAIAP
jgi:hypothetical protein